MLVALLVLAASPVQWMGPKPTLPVTRVITLAPSITESVLALGAGGTLIGVSRFCEFPEVKELPKAGGFNDISIETVVALKPQLVVVQMAPSNQKPVETLARMGISVLALPLTTVDDVATSLQVLGEALGKQARSKELVESLAQARADARAHRPEKPKRVLFVYGFSPLVVAGPGSFADELLVDCGAQNVAQKAATAYPVYSLEKVVTLTPDLIIDASDVADGREAMQRLGPLKQVKWATVPTKDLLHPGPALARALPSLCNLVH